MVALTTFSPAHFEGDWDKSGACPKKRPYRPGEKGLGYTEAEMRRTVVEAVRAAAGAGAGSGLRFEAVDVTALANLRPDGHPGPYMRKDPFGGGGGETGDGRVPNDCVHWCMPGPVDSSTSSCSRPSSGDRAGARHPRDGNVCLLMCSVPSKIWIGNRNARASTVLWIRMHVVLYEVLLH